MSHLSDWSEDETNAEDNEEQDEFVALSESEDEEFDCDVDIEGDESGE